MRAKSPALDRFRIAAAVLVAAIHTSPLTTYTADGDFFLTRVLARLAVPFFFLVTGYFLSRSEWNSLPRFLKKTGLLYLAGGIHGLPAGDHRVGSQVFEDGGQAVAGAHSQKTVFFLGGSHRGGGL